MPTVREVYKLFCFDLCEDAGLTLGVVTDQQFLDLFNLTISDFIKRTGLVKRIYTQSVFAGQAAYAFPVEIMRIDQAFLGGKWLNPVSVHSLNNLMRDWKVRQANPKYWHVDELPIYTIELAPAPRLSSELIFPATYPDPPYAVFDTFTAPVQTSPGVIETRTPAQHRGLTVIGPRKPAAVTSLDDPVPLLPDEWSLAYINFGILERLFSGDNEMKDVQRAAYCGAQYKEGLATAQAITGESIGDEL